MSVRLRPHHVLCAVGFEGVGHDAPSVANMASIVFTQLRGAGGRDVRVVVAKNADSICAPCPNRVGLGCAFGEIIEGLDRRHGAALDIAPGRQLTWGECLDKVRARVEPDDLDDLCVGCRWLPLGTCKANVAALRREA